MSELPDIRGEFVTPPDVVTIPVADLPPTVRNTIDGSPGDVAMTRLNSRTTTRVLDSLSAELIEAFAQPNTIVNAVIDFSTRNELDPAEVLDDAYPLVKRLLAEGLLAGADSKEAKAIVPSLEVGDRFEVFEVEDCIQALEDTEIYRVSDPTGEPALLKLCRTAEVDQGPFDRESLALRTLAGSSAPTLLRDSRADGRRYLLIEWIEGQLLIPHIRELQATGRQGRPAVLRVLGELFRAYERLHRVGIRHGDIHPRNVIVDTGGAVRLIDFGFADTDDGPRPPSRAGISYFFEPELAKAYLTGGDVPRSTEQGEQYAVAALAYFALLGSHTQDFSAEREEMLRQIVEDAPTPFSAHHADGLRETEATLLRAMAKDPRDRFDSMEDLCEAFESSRATDMRRHAARAERDVLDEVVARFVERAAVGRPDGSVGLDSAPSASVNYGAAGIAYALLRISQVKGDPRLLELAEAWSLRASLETGDESAFYNEEIDITRETVGASSLYHSANGVHTVRALIGHAGGDLASAQRSADHLAEGEYGSEPDLTLGESSVLIAGSLLRSLPPFEQGLDLDALDRACNRIADRLWSVLSAEPPLTDGGRFAYLGMAHGWAGYIYAQLSWCRATGRALPEGLPARLDQLAALAEHTKAGARWPWASRGEGSHSYMSGWCNGSAGHVFLWTLADEMLDDPNHLRLAEAAATNALHEPGGVDNLCCGYAGRAYAALALHRHTNNPEWLAAAEKLAIEAAAAPRLQDSLSNSLGIAETSLYKGRPGIAVLAADLEDPMHGAMPLFETPAWTETST